MAQETSFLLDDQIFIERGDFEDITVHLLSNILIFISLIVLIDTEGEVQDLTFNSR